MTTCSCETQTIGDLLVVVRPDPDCRKHGLPEGIASTPHLRRHARHGEDDRTVERRLFDERSNCS